MHFTCRLFLLCLLSSMSLSASAQNVNNDSLLNIIKTTTGKSKIDALNQLAENIVYDKPQAAKQYSLQSITLAKEIDYQEGLAKGYNEAGISYDVSGLYDRSIFFYEKSYNIFNKLNNLKGRGGALNNVGLIYWNKADYNTALKYFFDALQDFEKIKNDRFTANALNNIGLVYADVKKYDQSLTYHLKAKAIYEKINDPYLKGAVYNNLGNAYTNLKNNDSAEFYYKTAIEMQLIAKDDYGLSIAYNGYAGILAQKHNYKEAIEYFKKGYALKETLNEKVGQSSILINLAGIYDSLHLKTEELDCLLKAEKISAESGLKKDLIIVYFALAKYYETQNQSLSYEYYKKYSEIKDSVFNETSNHQITELNTKYETGKKELQLKEQELEINRKNYYLIAFSILLVLTSLLGLSTYKRYKLKQERKLQEEVLKQQDQATKAVIEAEENERKRIASDLHDGVGQMMSAAKMNLSVFESEFKFENEQQRTAFENVIGLVDEGCKEIRNVSHQMMPNALLKSGLASAVKEFIDKIDNRIIKVTLHTEGLNDRIDNNIETVLYRVLQECVNNVLKHSGANHLDISIIKDEDGIAATIDDNGKGFDLTKRKQTDGIGLKNMTSRINYLKGTIDFDSSPGKGTLVAIHVPVS